MRCDCYGICYGIMVFWKLIKKIKAKDSAIATAGSGFSLIKRLKANFKGSYRNQSISVKNVVNFSKSYVDTIAESSYTFWTRRVALIIWSLKALE